MSEIDTTIDHGMSFGSMTTYPSPLTVTTSTRAVVTQQI